MAIKTPVLPDKTGLSFIGELCNLSSPYEKSEALDSLFVSAMKQNLEWHRRHSPFFENLLHARRFDPGTLQTVQDCAKIPLIPAEFFKRHEIVSVPRDQITLNLTSSGTTGQKSQMFFDDWSITAPQKMVEFIFERNGWVTPLRPARYLLYTYEVESNSKLGTAFTDNYLCGFAPVKELFYALRRNGSGGFEFDPFGCISTLIRYATTEEPVRIFGFPAFLYFTLKRMKELNLPALKLPPGSLVFLGGGWKGHADQAVSPEALYQLVTEMLGIPSQEIRDGFGSVEHCIPYIECERHRFHLPIWSRVFIRDLTTLQPVPMGTVGFLNFVSPYMTSVPTPSVMMGDLASLHLPDECGCGIPTPYFKIWGRAGTSRNKSCAIAASELLRGHS